MEIYVELYARGGIRVGIPMMEVYGVYAGGGISGGIQGDIWDIRMMDVYGVVYVYGDVRDIRMWRYTWYTHDGGICGIRMCRDHHMRY